MATYSQPIKIEEYIDAVKNRDAAKLPPSLGGSYVVCVKPFVGTQPEAIDREDLVYIGKTEQNQVLYRATQLLIEELGASDDDADPGLGIIQGGAQSRKSTAILAHANCSSHGRPTHVHFARSTAYTASHLAVRSF